EFSNALNRAWDDRAVGATTWKERVEGLLLMLAPIAPHIAEELWERTGHPYSIHNQPFPRWNEELAREEVITLVVQVDGRVRDKLEVPADVAEEEAKRLALASPRVQAHLNNRPVKRLVYVPGRLVNLVTR
ncbi:MAG: class I tRNA ligase family protein, partial [Dehalococcoidia bacterium]